MHIRILGLCLVFFAGISRGDQELTGSEVIGVTASSSFLLVLDPVSGELDSAEGRLVSDAIATSVLVLNNDESSPTYLDTEAIIQESKFQSDSSLLRLRFFILATRESSPALDIASAPKVLNAQIVSTFETVSGQNLFLSFLKESSSNALKGVSRVAVAPVVPGSNGESANNTSVNSSILSTRDIVIIVVGAMIILGVCIMLLIQFWDQGHAHHARIRAANLDRQDGKVGGEVHPMPDTPSTFASGLPEFNVTPETPERTQISSSTTVATQTPPTRGQSNVLTLATSNGRLPTDETQTFSHPQILTPNWKLAIAESPKDTPPFIQNDNFFSEPRSDGITQDTQCSKGEATEESTRQLQTVCNSSFVSLGDASEDEDILSTEPDESKLESSTNDLDNDGSSSSSGYESPMQSEDPEDPFGVGSIVDEDKRVADSDSQKVSVNRKPSVDDWMQTVRVVASSEKSLSTETKSESNSTLEQPSLGVYSFGGALSLECDMASSTGRVDEAEVAAAATHGTPSTLRGAGNEMV